jgi:ATP-dependent RNA circularization protein (DNA/RNA ligase family)
MSTEQKTLPKFTRTKHLPLEPNAGREDLIASNEEYETVLRHMNVFVEEKIDGANCAITVVDGSPVIRNRNHILSKEFTSSKTPANMQFSSIWNWFYKSSYRFQDLQKILGFVPCVYGEWMYARHSVKYDLLPEYFIAFDIYNSEEEKFVGTDICRSAFEEVGISVVPILHVGPVNENILLNLREGPSLLSSTDKREGIYIKLVDDSGFVCGRYKMVRSNFIQGEHWSKRGLEKNYLKV